VLPFLFPGLGYGQFLSPNVFAYLMEMVLALTAGLILGGGLKRDRVLLYLAVMVPCWAALILSSSRGGILGAVCAMIFVVFISVRWYSARQLERHGEDASKWFVLGKSSWVQIALALIIVGAMGISVLWMGNEVLFSKMNRELSPDDAVENIDRQEIWRASWHLVRSNPWTGVGFGAYFLAIPQYQNSAGAVKLEQAHNDYLDLAANGGLIALVLGGWFVVNVIYRAKLAAQSRDPYRRAACLGASAGLLSVGVHSFVDFGLQVTGIAVVFAAVIVIAVAGRRVESGQTRA
jgi:O-antigen ligase